MKYKINKYIESQIKNSYAKENSNEENDIQIDCYEGINNISYSSKAISTFNNINHQVIKDYPHGIDMKKSIINYWSKNINTHLKADNIVLCNGSISGIYLVNRLFLEPKDKVLGYIPQFPEYGVDVEMHGATYEYYTLEKNNNYRFVEDKFISCINNDYKLIYIDNPNNPTGQVIPLDSIEKILKISKTKDIIVIIDEAYGDYMNMKNSALNLINSYNNLIVLKSFSKGFGLAGLRAGYIVIPKELNNSINKITNPYSITEISRRIAISVLEDDDFIKDTLSKNKKIKSQFLKPWKNLNISTTCDTVSICLIEHKNKNINLEKEFAKFKIGVIDGSTFKSLDKNSIRFRIPKEEDVQKVLEAFTYIDSL